MSPVTIVEVHWLSLNHVCIVYTGLSIFVVSGITLVISIPITSVITAIVTIFITYYCCIKANYKGGHNTSATGPPVLQYETPVPTCGVSSLEMKDNMAYGHVIIGTSENIPTTSAVYDTITT